MKLWQTRICWEKWAKRDPLWAVLSEPDKQGNRWQVDAFFQTGVDEVARDVALLKSLPGEARLGRALDFGCGVGRLSQALALHYREVVGVDIAEQMIAHAGRHNRHGERVTYVHNPSADLRVFPDNHFDLVYSLITLQHIGPDYIRAYLAEFVRICSPGGLIHFQLPISRPPPRARFSWYPPTLAKRLGYLISRVVPIVPIMEMHALPQEEVTRVLESSGAQVIDTRPHGAGDGAVRSIAYTARKH